MILSLDALSKFENVDFLKAVGMQRTKRKRSSPTPPSKSPTPTSFLHTPHKPLPGTNFYVDPKSTAATLIRDMARIIVLLFQDNVAQICINHILKFDELYAEFQTSKIFPFFFILQNSNKQEKFAQKCFFVLFFDHSTRFTNQCIANALKLDSKKTNKALDDLKGKCIIRGDEIA